MWMAEQWRRRRFPTANEASKGGQVGGKQILQTHPEEEGECIVEERETRSIRICLATGLRLYQKLLKLGRRKAAGTKRETSPEPQI
jgi:hypothetical protein